MKNLPILLLLAAMLCSCGKEGEFQVVSREENKAPFRLESGELTQLNETLWLKAEEGDYPNFQGVVVYSREGNGELRTVRAKTATIQNEEDIYHFSLNEAAMTVGDPSENAETVLMNSYSFDVVISPGWSFTPSSPFKERRLAENENKSFQYRVATDESLESIARMFIVSEADILRWNPDLKNDDDLKVGQLLWIRKD